MKSSLGMFTDALRNRDVFVYLRKTDAWSAATSSSSSRCVSGPGPCVGARDTGAPPSKIRTKARSLRGGRRGESTQGSRLSMLRMWREMMSFWICVVPS